jgi:integrase/recombinase XerD
MQSPPQGRANTRDLPPPQQIIDVWRRDLVIQDSSARAYLHWIRRFRLYLSRHGLSEHAELTQDGARRFIASYADLRGLDPKRLDGPHSALYALSRVYHVMGLSPLPWRAASRDPQPQSPLLQEYARHLLQRRGNPHPTVHKRLAQIGRFLEHLEGEGKGWSTAALTDIDAYLVACAGRYAPSTVGDIAGGVRSFVRFLLSTGRISVELGDAIISPVHHKYERPRRALAWKDVQRLLHAIDISSPSGLRDRAILLMMSTYGLGAGEVIRLQFQDVDWEASTMRAVRPKTGVAFTLPLLPAVARALAHYLRDGRPRDTPTKHLFVAMRTPFGPLNASGPIRHIIAKHAKAAGITAPYLGAHVLRHSNAARQVDLGIRPRVLSDLLGHRDSESISAYVRIATETLRDVSLPVPR